MIDRNRRDRMWCHKIAMNQNVEQASLLTAESPKHTTESGKVVTDCTKEVSMKASSCRLVIASLPVLCISLAWAQEVVHVLISWLEPRRTLAQLHYQVLLVLIQVVQCLLCR